MEGSQLKPPTEGGTDAIKATEKGAVEVTHKRRVSIKETDTESCLDDRGADVRESDFKKRQVNYLSNTAEAF